MARPFLTAQWSNLFLATCVVPPEMLERRLPPGLTLDRRESHAFASLVAFDFLAGAQPYSTVLAAGSPVAVYREQQIVP